MGSIDKVGKSVALGLAGWKNRENIGDVYDFIYDMNDGIYDAFLAAKRWMPRVDPLTLDLDGDGIETVAASASNPILFDHDGDGIKNGTGWVKGDDGFLVMDRNSNGVIDNSAELFGDSTPLSAGGKAKDGFDALELFTMAAILKAA